MTSSNGKRGRKPVLRSTILDAAVRVLATHPTATLQEVAAEAGVGRATLYRYFPNREALIIALADASLAETATIAEHLRQHSGCPRDYFEALLAALLEQGEKYHYLSTDSSALNDPRINAAYAEQLERMHELICQLQQEGVLDDQLPSSWINQLLDGLIYSAWQYAQTTGASEELAGLVLHSLYKGAGGPARS